MLARIRLKIFHWLGHVQKWGAWLVCSGAMIREILDVINAVITKGVEIFASAPTVVVRKHAPNGCDQTLEFDRFGIELVAAAFMCSGASRSLRRGTPVPLPPSHTCRHLLSWSRNSYDRQSGKSWK
jgi:hypothetical protein